jgi:hypothetical protein
MNNIETVIGNYGLFLDKIFKNLASSRLESSRFKEIDHICYRVETEDQYKLKKHEFINFGTLISEKIIAGRLISVFKLFHPIKYKDYSIPCIELPAPKNPNKFKEGLEHAEIAINTSLENYRNLHPNIDWKLDAMDKKINPELIVEFSDCTVKFHEKSIEEIIEIEK